LLFPKFLSELSLSSFFFLTKENITIIIPTSRIINEIIATAIIVFSNEENGDVHEYLLFVFTVNNEYASPPKPRVVRIYPITVITYCLLIKFFRYEASLIQL